MTNYPRIVKQSDEHWTTVYPIGIEKYYESYYDAVEIIKIDPHKAERIFKRIISACGNGHIDAVLHLGILFCDSGKNIEGSALIAQAYRIAQEAIPVNFNPGIDRLQWYDIENRAILRAFYYFGIELMNEQNFERAIKEFEFILNVNPDDNQGVRFLLLACYFKQDRIDDILKLEKFFPEEQSIEFLYGKFLALYLLDMKNEAAKQLIKAQESYPFVVEEIISTHSIIHEDDIYDTFEMDNSESTSGSKRQAIEYLQQTQSFWEKAKDIKLFIKNTI